MQQSLRMSFWLKGLGIASLIAIIVLWHSASPERVSGVSASIGASVDASIDKVGDVLEPLGVPIPLRKKFCAPVDTEILRNISSGTKFAPRVSYWKRYVRPTPSLTELRVPSYTAMNESLLPDSAAFQIHGAALDEPELKVPCLKPINLPITKSPPSGAVDMTPLIMGISTNIKRLRQNSIEHFQRFLTGPISPDKRTRAPNGAGFVVHLHNATDEELDEGRTLLEEAGIEAVIKLAELDESMPERYLSLIPSLLEQSNIDALNGKKRTWLVLIDDDTFFPRPHALLKQLNHQFPTADEEKIMAGGYREVLGDRSPEYTQLQGGAGIFLTIPMAKSILEIRDIPKELLEIKPEDNKIPEHRLKAKKGNILDICLEEHKFEPNGDVRLCKCVRDHTGIISVNVPGLHQMDIFGDLSGFYESGGPFLSTHHWKSWNHFNPEQQSTVGDVCGEDCIFQRWIFDPTTFHEDRTLTDDISESWPMVLSNGFSISEYEPEIFAEMDLDMAEATFNDFFMPLFNMDYGVGKSHVMREKVKEGMKLQWGLLKAGVSKENEAWRSQWYGLRNRDGEVEKIAELVWVGGN